MCRRCSTATPQYSSDQRPTMRSCAFADPPQPTLQSPTDPPLTRADSAAHLAATLATGCAATRATQCHLAKWLGHSMQAAQSRGTLAQVTRQGGLQAWRCPASQGSLQGRDRCERQRAGGMDGAGGGGRRDRRLGARSRGVRATGVTTAYTSQMHSTNKGLGSLCPQEVATAYERLV